MRLTYDWSLDLDDANNTTTQQYHAVPPGSLVLDVGCATGFLGAGLQHGKGCRVVGVEMDAAQAEEARSRGLDVLTGDVTDREDRRRLLELAGRAFDVVVAGDVLEHLTDPFAALRTVVDELLDPTGLVVSSIPNVAHGSIRLDLLRGRFRYTETGLLDRTHVQLFTHERIAELFAAADLEVVADQRSYFPILGTEGRVAEGEFPPGVVEMVGADPESWVYQYVTAARPRARRPRGAATTAPAALQVVVVVVGEATAATVTRVLDQLPGTVTVASAVVVERVEEAVDHLRPLPPERLVMVVDADVVPEPVWTGPLFEARRVHGVPVGAITTSPGGVVVAAGRTSDGRPRGAGERVTWGFVDADAHGVTLTLPLLATAGELVASAGRPVGRVVRRAVARTRRPVPLPHGAGPSDMVGDAGVTLVVGDVGPHRLPVALRAALVDAAAGEGTVVYHWPVRDLLDVPGLASHMADAGVVLAPTHHGAGDPTTAGLARAMDVGCVLWLDPERAATEAMGVGLRHPAARRVAAASLPVAGCDATVAPSSITVEHLRPAQAQHVVVDVPAVARAAAIDGRTSVVVVMHGLADMTARCLAAVRATTLGQDVEIVLVDNGSPAGAVERACAGAVDVRVVRLPENLGFARGANAGIDVTTGAHVCILNNDTEPLAGWLDAMHEALAVEDVVMVASRSDEVSGLQRLGEGPRLATAPEAARTFWTEHAAARRGSVFPLSRLVAVCLLVRRATLEEHGGFAVPDALGNFEDDELSSRLLAAGGDLVVADGAVVLHHGSATFRAAGVDYSRQMLRAARSLDAPAPVGGLTAMVLSDGDAATVAATVASVAVVCDRVLVRAPLHVAELGTAMGADARVAVAATVDPDVAPGRVLVLAAGEHVVVDDPHAARTALWSAPGDAAVVVQGGRQLRWLPVDGLDRLARSEGAAVPGMRIDVVSS